MPEHERDNARRERERSGHTRPRAVQGRAGVAVGGDDRCHFVSLPRAGSGIGSPPPGVATA